MLYICGGEEDISRHNIKLRNPKGKRRQVVCLGPSNLCLASHAQSCAQLCSTVCDPVDCSLPDSSVHGIFPVKNAGVGCHFLIQGIVSTQGSNPSLLCVLHYGQILYH